jgi:hypothetical protein
MPLIPSFTIPIIEANLVSARCVGINSIQIATAVANGLQSYALAGIKASTVDEGNAGAGYGQGTATLAPSVIVPLMAGAFESANIAGPNGLAMSYAIATSLSECISSSIVNTSHSTVGLGYGSGSLIPSSGSPFFIREFATMGIVGTLSISLATAIGNALDASLPSTSVNVVISGSGSPTIVSGVGVGLIT